MATSTLPNGIRPSSDRIHTCSGVAFFRRHGLGPLQAAARALDQQGAQVGVATTADRAQARMTAAGVLGRHQSQPGRQLPTLLKFARVADRGDRRIGGDRSDTDDRAQPNTTVTTPYSWQCGCVRAAARY
jgi:hypothetical protein